MNRLSRLSLSGAALAVMLAGCAGVVPGRAGTAPSWVDERLAGADIPPPPGYVPEVERVEIETIEVAAVTRRLMAIGDHVRDRAEAIASRPVDTEGYLQESRRRGTPPPENGSR